MITITQPQPEPLTTFINALYDRRPELTCLIDEGEGSEGTWWVDVYAKDAEKEATVTVSWNFSVGFGIYLGPEDAAGFGNKPDEVVPSYLAVEVAARVKTLLEEGLSLVPRKRYTEEERRVCDYLQQIAPEIGCGDDPIGFLIASHAALVTDLKILRQVNEVVQ